MCNFYLILYNVVHFLLLFIGVISTMDGMFEDGIEEFINYQKDVEGKKTRQQKRKQKVQKLTKDLNDPQLRKQRHKIRRQQQKAKLQRELQGMNQEQARVYLDKKKQAKLLAKERNIKALQIGMPILIDAIYEDRMNDKENKSLAIQVQLIMKAIKHMEDPPGIHLCSVAGGFKAQLEKMKYHYWTLTSSADDIVEVAKKLGKNPVYLSPDSPDELNAIDPNAAYIIGGLVDRTVIKNASFDRAQELGIPSVRLPIREYMKSRKCLNLDHVVSMICKFKQVGDWKIAFDFAAPKRWKKDVQKQSKGKRIRRAKKQWEEGQKKQEDKEQVSNQNQSSQGESQSSEDENKKQQQIEITNSEATLIQSEIARTIENKEKKEQGQII